MPFLLDCDEPCVVIDIKRGENAKLTAKAREKMGHRVVLIDAFHCITDHPDTYNPIGGIDPDSATAIDDCRAAAEALVLRGTRESEPYWDDSAEIWIGAMICAMVALAPPHQRNLQSVRAQSTDPAQREGTIDLMGKSPLWEGMLSRIGSSLKNYQGKTLDSVLTATNRHMTWCDTLAIAESTRQSSFDPADLLKGKMTIFLILPTEYTRTLSALLRLWISSLLRVCIKGGLHTP